MALSHEVSHCAGEEQEQLIDFFCDQTNGHLRSESSSKFFSHQAQFSEIREILQKMSDEQKKIALWTCPRSLSTAFCRAMYSRKKCKVCVCRDVPMWARCACQETYPFVSQFSLLQDCMQVFESACVRKMWGVLVSGVCKWWMPVAERTADKEHHLMNTLAQRNTWWHPATVSMKSIRNDTYIF